jgi:hypothetical protein
MRRTLPLSLKFFSGKVKKEIEAQVTITQEFSKQVGKAMSNGFYGQNLVREQLIALTGRDMNLTAAQVSNAGTGATQLSAGNNLKLNTVTTASSQSLNWDANNRLSQTASQDVLADQNVNLQAAGSVKIDAAQNAFQVPAGVLTSVAMCAPCAATVPTVYRRVGVKKKGFWCHHQKPLISLPNLAPRPGLEPGTYGLTVRRSTD